MRYKEARSQVKLETCSLDLRIMLAENKMGCSKSLAEVAAQNYYIYVKVHTSTAQEQTTDLQEQKLFQTGNCCQTSSWLISQNKNILKKLMGLGKMFARSGRFSPVSVSISSLFH